MGAGVVIVGAGVGGVRLADNLRQAGFDAPVTLLGDEPHLPYDRPPLSKAVLRGQSGPVALKPTEWYSENDIDLRVGNRVTDVDMSARVVSLPGGDGMQFESLVIATGLTPRTLPVGVVDGPPHIDDIRGVHVVRTADDVANLRAELWDGIRAAVVGAGFIGCEVAASLSQMGAIVTIVEPAPTVLHAVLGPDVGTRIGKMHTSRGVRLRTGAGVTGLLTSGAAVVGVAVDTGEVIDAEIVVVGIGSVPSSTLAESIGVELADARLGGGVLCDAHGRTSVPGVYALGDVANWADASGRHGRRVEHWNHTIDQAAVLAREIIEPGSAAALPDVHYFWTDQFELKVQCIGSPLASDDVHLLEEDGEKFVAAYSRGGALTAVVGAGRAGAVMRRRADVGAARPVTELLENAPQRLNGS